VIEKDRHRKAFELYYSSGDARSLSKLATRLGLALNTVKNWSSQFGWQERLEEREKEVGRVLATKTLRSEVDSRLRNKQLIQVALVQIAKQLAEGRIKATLGDLDKLIRLERYLDGMPDSRQEVVTTDLAGKTTEELKRAIREEIAELAELADYEIVTDARSDDGPRPTGECADDDCSDETNGAASRPNESP
jgi:hypothetical protein